MLFYYFLIFLTGFFKFNSFLILCFLHLLYLCFYPFCFIPVRHFGQLWLFQMCYKWGKKRCVKKNRWGEKREVSCTVHLLESTQLHQYSSCISQEIDWSRAILSSVLIPNRGKLASGTSARMFAPDGPDGK